MAGPPELPTQDARQDLGADLEAKYLDAIGNVDKVGGKFADPLKSKC